MREILFRGKMVDKEEWVYGYYVVKAWKHFIWSRQYIQTFEVISETVGQFTGLTDKNGTKIFEGDILNGRNQVLKIVYWCNKRSAFCENEQFKPKPVNHSFAKLFDKFGKIFNDNNELLNYIVIGSIHDKQ